MKRLTLAGLIALNLAIVPVTRAQFSANNQTNVISGVTSNWAADYIVGNFNSGDCLLIQHGGQLTDYNSYVGYQNSGSSNNSIVVADSGSVWSNRAILYFGYTGARNSIVISNGAKVFNNACVVGYIGSSTSNSILVTDSGTVWNNSDAIDLSYNASGGGHNSLVISNGAVVLCNADSSYNDVGIGSNNSNRVVVTGAGSAWKGVYNVYLSSVGDSVVVCDGGTVFGNTCFMHGNQCRVLITDSGSIWSNRESFLINGTGLGNSLVISNGASLLDNAATVYASNSSIVVTGSGSLWHTRSTLALNSSSQNNSLLISDNAQVVNGTGSVGGSSNTVRVTGGGIWQNTGLTVGNPGPGDSLVVAGGSVVASSLLIGAVSASCDSFVQLDAGSVVVTNGTHDAVLEVRYGRLIVNGGTLRVDQFVMTNSCAQLIRTGGTLIYGSAVLDPNRDDDGDGMANGWEQAYGLDPLNAADASADNDGDGQSNLQEYLAGTDPTNSASAFRVLSIVPANDNVLVSWKAGGGRTNVLQSAPDLTGSYTNISPNIILSGTGDTTTNYLDAGGGTNGASRYYRVRLVP